MTKTDRIRELMRFYPQAEVYETIVREYGPHTPRLLAALWSNAQKSAKANGRPRKHPACKRCHGSGREPEAA